MASSPIASASRARSMSAKDGGASMEGLADAARAWRIEHILRLTIHREEGARRQQHKHVLDDVQAERSVVGAVE